MRHRFLLGGLGNFRTCSPLMIALFLACRPHVAPSIAAPPAPAASSQPAPTLSPEASPPVLEDSQERRLEREPREVDPAVRRRVVLAYYPSWDKAKFDASKIDFSLLTHLAHAFTWPDSQGNFIVPAGYLDPGLIAAAHARGVKVLTSVGGWGNGGGFPGTIASHESRRRFIDQVVGFLRANGYDGVDLDWEFVSNAVERVRFTLLVEELGAALKAERPPKLLTMAAPAANYWGRWIAYEEIADDLDLVGFMTYDYHGEWSDHAGHNAPLRSGGDPCGSVEESLRYGLARGVPPGKLLIGLPFFGRSFDSPGLYQKFTKTGSYDYAEVRALQNAGWAYHWDEAAGVPYLLRPDAGEIVSFDDERSIAEKCAFVRAMGTGGVIIWEVTQDSVAGRPVLLEVVARELNKEDAAPGGDLPPGGKR